MQSGMAGRATCLRALVSAVLALLLALVAHAAVAHNLPYALVDVQITSAGGAQLALRCHLTPLLLGLPQGAPDDAAAARLLSMSDAGIATRSAKAAAGIRGLLSVRADGSLLDEVAVRLPSPAAIRAEAAAPRPSPAPSAPILIDVNLPTGAKSIDVALPPSLGPAVVSVRYPDGRTITTPVADGARSPAIRLAGPNAALDKVEAVVRFLGLGFQHILPGGLDHILFVVALTLGAPRLWPVVKLATTFTAAHSITLSLAALGLVSAPPSLVEPAITLSIAAAALLSLVSPRQEVGVVRLAVVFGFGLLHGLGFASALQETGLPRGAELPALAAFNLGIELAQIAVIVAALATLRLVVRVARNPLVVSRGATACVAIAGLVWTIGRLAAQFAAPPHM